jgi:hypothetical protein
MRDNEPPAAYLLAHGDEKGVGARGRRRRGCDRWGDRVGRDPVDAVRLRGRADRRGRGDPRDAPQRGPHDQLLGAARPPRRHGGVERGDVTAAHRRVAGTANPTWPSSSHASTSLVRWGETAPTSTSEPPLTMVRGRHSPAVYARSWGGTCWRGERCHCSSRSSGPVATCPAGVGCPARAQDIRRAVR